LGEFKRKRAGARRGDPETWAQGVDGAWLRGTLIWYSGAAGREMGKPRALAIAHLFNHQTHHRGQIHAMLTAAVPSRTIRICFLVDELR
jgi:uncharacterized damage-inducible protein DinB